MGRVLSSVWDGLNPYLLASIWEVDKNGNRVNHDLEVRAPLTESDLEVEMNWQSPFENASQNTLPTAQQVAQSGVAQPVANVVDNVLGTNTSGFLDSVKGRATVTKLNSTQVFSGMPPFKFNITALFRAWMDPVDEVHEPFDQLMKWALPEYLAPDGPLSRVGKGGLGVDTLLPSKVPTLIAVKYKDCVYSPLVIESITKQTNSPINNQGFFTSLEVPMRLASLTAIDRNDWDVFTGMKVRGR